MLSLEQLNAFRSAAELGSFSAAARAMNKSLSAVSSSVIALEDSLGVSLFDRSTKYPKLTAQGQRLYNQSLVLFKQVKSIEQAALDSLSNIEEHVRIGMGELIPNDYVETHIEKLSTKFPNTRVSLVRGDHLSLQNQLLNNSLDVALTTAFGTPEDELELVSIRPVEMVCVCSPDSHLADEKRVSISSLFSSRQIACQAMINNPFWSKYMLFSPEVWDTSNLSDSIMLVEQGIGWACIPLSIAQPRDDSGSLKIFDSDASDAQISMPVDAIYRQSTGQGMVALHFLSLLTGRAISARPEF